MRTKVAPLLLAAAALSAGPLPARADCMCAANGTRYDQGAVVCLTVSGRSFMARCGKVLNNSSWEKVGDGCPEAAGPPAAASPRLSSAGTAGRPG